MGDGCLLHTSLVVSVTAGGRLPHMYIKYTNAHIHVLRRVFSIICYAPWGTMLNKGLEIPNLTSSTIDQLIPLQSRAPDIPPLSHHPHSFSLFNPIHTFCFGRWAQRWGEGRQKGFSQASYHGGSQWICLENTLLKWNAFVVEKSIA